ncbi:hypothetical protein OIU84_002736 [Salix udensis]|uniref:Uncharacterized protein n=1 Tax=Salix udensis TaxID=889485 RepID=A0AAD6P528_9ROSI|nr:hypothetical protein OIU84_002736 [Salix udensis]
MMKNAWVRCQIALGQCPKSLPHLQPQGYTGQKVFIIILIQQFLCLIYVAQLCKTLITANSVALFPNGSGSGSCRPLFFVSFIAKREAKGMLACF